MSVAAESTTTSQTMSESAEVGELNWAADWGGFASRGKVVAKPQGKLNEKPKEKLKG